MIQAASTNGGQRSPDFGTEERFFLAAYRLGGGMSSGVLVESADTLHLA